MTELPFLVVDEKLAKHLQIGNAHYCLFPGLLENCKWLIPKEQYTAVTKSIIAGTEELAKIFVEKYYKEKLPYKEDALYCFFNGFGGLLTFFIADRLIRVNKFIAVTGNSDFLLPDVPLDYDSSWSHSHLFYNLIEQNGEFNQWLLNQIFFEKIAPKAQFNNTVSKSLYFENFLPEEEKRKLRTEKFFRFLTLLRRKVWDEREVGIRRLKIFFLWQSSFKVVRKILSQKMREFNYALSSLGRDIPWDGLGPIPDPYYDYWGFKWPWGRLCYQGQDPITDRKLNTAPKFDREKILELSEPIAEVFRKILVEVDGRSNIDPKNLNNIAKIFQALAPRCFVEDISVHAENFLKQFKPFENRTYFCGGTFAAYSSAFRMFACRELNIEVISTQHSAWGGYFANGPLVTEFLIKGSDKYITFGWDKKPMDGSAWRDQAIPLSAPLTSKMFLARKPFNPSVFRKKVLLCPGFIYRFPSIYNSALRVDNLHAWAGIIKNIVDRLARENIQVDIVMYNDVMAGNMRQVLNYWLSGNEDFVREYKNHDVKVRYILNDKQFGENYDAVVWDLMAGGFIESVASNIPTFALWSEHLHIATPEGKPIVRDLLSQGILFESGEGLVASLRRFYSRPNDFLYDNNLSLQNFFNSFVRINENWLSEWKTFFKKLK